MAEPSIADLASPRTSAAGQKASPDNKVKVTRARSDISDDTEDGDGPSSPHFYSLSVRKSSPSLDSYHADSVNSASNNLDNYDIDGSIKEDLASEQQVNEQAVKLDLLRRQHSQRARHTLEQLQTAASTASQRSDSPTRKSSTEFRRTSSGVSMGIVRQQSEQLKQASGDLKRLAEEQRTLAEEAVASFLLKEDMMMIEGHDKSAGSSQTDAGLSQALNAVFEEQHGTSRNSLTKQMEKIRKAEQAIKDAEADECIADQLAALQLTLSQLADQEGVGDTAEAGTHADATTTAGPDSQGLPPGRVMLKDISENSQEGLGSSQGRSSSPGQSQGRSHMAASAFAAVSQINGFQGDSQLDQEDQGEADPESVGKDHSDQDVPADQIRLGSAEIAQAEQQTAQHEEHQAQSPDNNTITDANTSKTDAKAPQIGPKGSQTDSTASPTGSKASSTQSTPLTEATLKALTVNTDAIQSEAPVTPTTVPGTDQDPAPASLAPAASQGSDLAGSTPGSHTYDSELHDGIAALVQAPGITDKADTQPSGGIIASDLDAATMGIQGLTTADSHPDSASSQPDAEAAQEGAAAADQVPVYSLESDEEDDLAVVSGEDQARKAEAAASQFMESSSQPATPDENVVAPPQDPPLQASPSIGPPAAPSDCRQQQDDSASESAADVSAYASSEYHSDARMADAFEPEEFRGMLFHDGVDSQGRPVIVVNTDAVGTSRKARAQALQYMLHRLEPIVVQGPYVLVMVATGQQHQSNKLPAMWLISAYRSLSRPFRKNVRYILLVRPTGGLKALVACIRPFVSAKAAKKVKKVDSLASIAAATSNEVTLQHLGSRFAAAAGNYFLEGVAIQSATANPYDMPHF